MEPLKENDVRPELGTFTLSATGEHIHTIRKMTVDDRAWFYDTFKVSLEERMSKGIPESEFMRVIYRLISDKSVFKPRTIKDFDEDGNPKEETVGGVRLFMRMIEVPIDYGRLGEALNKTIKASSPPEQKEEKKTEPETDPNQMSFVGEKPST